MTIESDLLTPDRQGDRAPAAPPVETPPPEPAPVETPLNLDDEAAVTAALQENAIVVPDGEALVQGSQAGKIAHQYREKLREARAKITSLEEGSSKLPALEQQVAQLTQQLQQITPYAQAYQAALQAQPVTPDPQETAELEEIARDFDFYTDEGKLNLDKARRQQARETARAQKIARQEVAPIHQQNVSQQSAYYLARAKNTAGANGLKPDPAILDQLWQRLDPAITARSEGAVEVWIAAMGRTVAAGLHAQDGTQRGPDGKFVPKQPPAPLYTEKAGGKDEPTGGLTLTAGEQAFIKNAGMTEKEYLETAKNMPGGRR